MRLLPILACLLLTAPAVLAAAPVTSPSAPSPVLEPCFNAAQCVSELQYCAFLTVFQLPNFYGIYCLLSVLLP